MLCVLCKCSVRVVFVFNFYFLISSVSVPLPQREREASHYVLKRLLMRFTFLCVFFCLLRLRHGF